jgi:hypothetical protein
MDTANKRLAKRCLGIISDTCLGIHFEFPKKHRKASSTKIRKVYPPPPPHGAEIKYINYCINLIAFPKNGTVSLF